MKKLMTRHFSKWASKQKMPSGELSKALDEVEKGLFDANLGGHIFKKRVRFQGRGKRGSGGMMRNSIAESISSTINDLYQDGLVDEITMKNIHQLCLPEIKEYPPEEIVALRKKFKLSQAALATMFNVSLSTVQKWERGKKKPTGSSRKLLDIVERKGIEVLM